ncbi:hypothetical protein MKX03_030716 [Papaver bracteatum]|nr:hypothetical protein MKX03_030716 [Papaver bracteatum]
MSAAPAKMITLKSSDEQFFVLERTSALQSDTLKNMIAVKETENLVIPLTTITGSILAKVIEYCNKHAEIETSDEDKKIWDAKFGNIHCTDTLLEITAAAIFLKINGLLDLASEKVGDTILYTAPEEIRRIFNIEKEFATQEEESQWGSEIMDLT